MNSIRFAVFAVSPVVICTIGRFHLHDWPIVWHDARGRGMTDFQFIVLWTVVSLAIIPGLGLWITRGEK